MLRHVDLCSGIGGFALGFEWAGLSEPVMFCDTEKWCRQILKKHWPDVPITEDVKELASDPERYVPDCDILTAGYPCQPFSVAGKQRGEKDDRHIWPYIRKIVAHKRPTWCVFENVYGHVALGLDKVLADLEAEGYSSRAFIVPACGVDAHHKRDRLWIVAYSEYDGSSPDQVRGGLEEAISEKSTRENNTRNTERASSISTARKDVADTSRVRLQGSAEEQIHGKSDLSRKSRRGRQDIERRWPTESSVGRVADGIPRRMDRIKGLGNAIVPQIAQRIGNTIKEYERSTSA
jgi:DNA (cytosine-5)-methyltransferase 1